MKFVIITAPKGNLPPEAAGPLFQAAKQWIDAKIEDGTIETIYGFPAGGAVTISNADSHEELMRTIRDFPLFPFTDWDIRPLVDINESFDSAIAMFQKMGAPAGT
jgi:muconolactone delta-isomerase